MELNVKHQSYLGFYYLLRLPDNYIKLHSCSNTCIISQMVYLNFDDRTPSVLNNLPSFYIGYGLVNCLVYKSRFNDSFWIRVTFLLFRGAAFALDLAYFSFCVFNLTFIYVKKIHEKTWYGMLPFVLYRTIILYSSNHLLDHHHHYHHHHYHHHHHHHQQHHNHNPRINTVFYQSHKSINI